MCKIIAGQEVSLHRNSSVSHDSALFNDKSNFRIEVVKDFRGREIECVKKANKWPALIESHVFSQHQ